MRLFSPWALIFLFLIPPIILMYILKQKYEERIVSSTYLWEKALLDIEVNTPWQKLKKNLLLYLQLLSVLLLIFALTNPYILMGKGEYQNIIVIIDNSGSMNANYEGTTRLEAAKNMASDMVKSSSPGSKFTVITSGSRTEILLNASSNKSDAVSKINEIHKSNSGGKIEEALSLTKALSKQYEGCYVTIYSDHMVDMTGLRGEIAVIASKLQNASVDHISHTVEGDKIKALVRIRNESDVNISREISLFAEEKLIDIQSVDLKSGESKNIYFDDIPLNNSYIYAEITEPDGLMEDNCAYDIIKSSKTKKGLIVTDKNIFIEKMLSIIPGIELYKALATEKTDRAYDFYIYDGSLPHELPKSGNILVINPPYGNVHFKTGEAVKGGALKAEPHVLTKYINNTYASVSKLKAIDLPYWAETIMSVDGKPAVIAGENKGQRIVEIAFDLHDSDFVLNPEYPIFFSNMMEYLIGTECLRKTTIKSGETLDFCISSEVTEAYVSKPSGEIENISLNYPIAPFEGTEELGIYKVIEKIGEDERYNLFCANFPSKTESNINGEEGQQMTINNNGNQNGKSERDINISLYLILAGFLTMATEWAVYTRGY